MLYGKVIGNIISTRKHQKLIGLKLLEVQLYQNKILVNDYVIAIDSVGAGKDEIVLLTTGSSARLALDNFNNEIPTDLVIVGIVDSL